MGKTAEFYMKAALALANEAENGGEVPVGAVLELDGMIIGQGHNSSIGTSDPTAHAEIIALRGGGVKLGNYRLTGSVLYITLEPCIMCYTAAVHARINKIIYGAADPKSGIFSTGAFRKIESIFNHPVEIESGVLEKESSELLKNFFRLRR